MKSFFRFLIVGLGMLCSIQAKAQLNFTPQYMNRAEYRHGYQSLADTGQKAAAFVSQRTRLTGEYKAERYKIVIGIQDIRTWGSVGNAAIDTKGLMSVSEAYAEINLSRKILARLGRQILAYDDDRIIGSLDWAMQSRRHDLALLQYKDSTLTLHGGFAFNQDKEQFKTTIYTVQANYKTFQYLWANKQFKKSDVSLLVLNNGLQFGKKDTVSKPDTITVFSQTTGIRATYKGDIFSGVVYGYYQFGKDGNNNPLSAYCASAEASCKLGKLVSFTLGAEILSGTSQLSKSTTNRSFTPFYGTNHRHNGYMDYFYLGNHLNTVGLFDKYAKLNFSYKQFLLGLNAHFFDTAEKVRNTKAAAPNSSMPSYLGTELDITIGCKVADEISLQAGYSQMFGSSTIMMLKGGNTRETSNWAYLMVIVRPGKVKWPKVGLKM